MRRKRIPVGAFALAAMFASGQAASAQQSTASATASAQIVAPSLNLTQVNPLAFGRIKSDTAGTVIIDVHGRRTSTGGVTLVGSGQCNTTLCDTTNQSSPNSASFWSPGVYTFSGTPGATYRVSTPSTTATAILKSGTTTLTTLAVTDIVVATAPTWDSNIGQLDANGQGTVRVGGVLQVPGGLNASSYYSYEAQIPVTIVFN